jgi:hypothetical protein
VAENTSSAREAAKIFVEPMRNHLAEAGVGFISELFNSPASENAGVRITPYLFLRNESRSKFGFFGRWIPNGFSHSYPPNNSDALPETTNHKQHENTDRCDSSEELPKFVNRIVEVVSLNLKAHGTVCEEVNANDFRNFTKSYTDLDLVVADTEFSRKGVIAPLLTQSLDVVKKRAYQGPC